ncbi:hypothetical protein AB0H87_38405, partial [Asanoa sp. NPDC050611]
HDGRLQVHTEGGVDDAVTKELFGRLDLEAARLGRQVLRSVCVSVACGRDAATVERRAALLRPPVRAAASGVYGSVDQVVDHLGEFAAIGAARAYVRIADLADLDHLDLLAGEVMPQVAA